MGEYSIQSLLFTAVIVLIGQTVAARCPNDWVNFDDSCYVFVDEFVPWTSAEAICRVLGAQMLEVGSRAENDFIAGQIQARNGVYNVWMGLQDFVREGRWVWNSNKEVPEYFNWAPGEPNNNRHFEGGEDCVQLYGATGLWDDAWCEQTYDTNEKISVVCEMDVNDGEVIG